MSNETIILAQNLATVSAGSAFSYTNKTPGPGYYRQDDTERTASYDFTNFTGTVKIQASLELQPGNSDWFDVSSTVRTTSSAVNTTENYSFTGNFIWIRAAYNLQSGTINRIAVDGIAVTSATSGAEGGSPTSVAFANITNKPTTVAGYGITDAVSASDLGAFEFSGSTMTTTDSTPIVIDQSVTVGSDLTVGGDLLPSVAQGGDLGSAAKPWRSLYVSNNTVFLGGVPLSLEAGTNELTINNVPISQTINYADIPNIPTDISDLTDTGNLLAGGGGGAANTGDITFANSTISAGANDEIKLQGQDDDGVSVRLRLEPEYGTAELSAFSGENVNTFTISNADFATGVWQNNGFGIGVVSFTDAQNIGDFFQNTLTSLTPTNVTISINGGTPFLWNGGTSGSGTTTPGLSNTPTVPPSPVAITSISFRYRQQSYISVNYDNQEIRLDAQNASIRIDATNSIQMYGDSNIDLQAQTTFRIAANEDIDIGTGSAYAVRVTGGDFVVSASDDISITGNDSFRLRNDSPTAPIRIITDDNNTSKTWAFNADGTLTFPDATVQTTAFTGTADIARNIESESDVSIRVNLTDSTTQVWRFGEDGDLRFPDGTIQTTAFTGIVEADTLDSVTDRNAATTNNITVGAVITTDINNKLSAATGNIVTNVRHWESAGASLYIWFDAASKPDVKAIGDFGDITGWTVSVSDGNSATVTATNPAGYFSISTSVALTGSGTLTFTSPDYVAPQPLPIDINVGTNTWTFDNNGDLTLPETVSAVGPQISAATISNGGSDYQGVIITPDPDYNGGYGLKIYPGGPVDPEASHLHLTATDPSSIDLFLGDDDHYAKVAADGMVELNGNSVRLWGDGVMSNAHLNLPNDSDSASVPTLLSNYGAGGVLIQSGNTPYNWEFGADGGLTIPGDIKSETAINIDINLIDSTLRRWTFGEDGELMLPSDGKIRVADGSRIRLESHYSEPVGNLIGSGFSLDPSQISINYIEIDNGNEQTRHQWDFSVTLGTLDLAQGGLRFHNGTDFDGTTVTMPTTTTGTTNSFVWEFSDQVIGSDTITLNWNLLATEQGGFYFGTTHSTNGKYLFLDGTDQSLSYFASGVPGNGRLIFGAVAGNNAGDANAIELKAGGGDVYLTSTESVKITVDAADSSAKVWTFDPTGNLNIPGSIVGSDTIEISNTSAGVAQDINIYSADNILLQGANRTAAGEPEGGDINIYAGDGAPDNGISGSSSGGDLEIFAGDGGDGSATGFAGPGGNIEIRAGEGGADNGGGGGDGGNIAITAGDATNAAQDRGHISITSGGGGDETTNGGYVEITIPSAGTHPGGSWLFSGAGNVFEVPADAEIICVNNGGITVGTFNHPTNITVQNTFTTSTYTWAFDDDGTLTFPDSTVQSTAFTLSPTLNVLKIDDGVHEKYQELADATGTVTHDCSAGHIFYHSSPDANWTVNLTNLNLSAGYATTVTIIIDQGGTGYYPNAIQIGAATPDINWQGNATPTPSTNRQDVVSFSILAVSGGSYIVFGQLTGF